MARKFGIITSVENLQAGIVVNSITRNESAEIAEARNEKGQITDLAAYSRAESISVQGVIDDAKGTIVKAGSKLTLDTVDYIVESVDKPETNTGLLRGDDQRRTADGATIIPDCGGDQRPHGGQRDDHPDCGRVSIFFNPGGFGRLFLARSSNA